MPIKVVTDSTSDLPAEVAQRAGITVVPLNVHFGTESYKDGVDLSHDEFYRRLVSSPHLPTTSQPSVGELMEVYRRLAQGSEGIISIHVSSRLSGTYNSALQAREESGTSCPIEVVDTLQASMGLGVIALAVAEAAKAGAHLTGAVEVANNVIPRAEFFGLVDTLDYLERGGRIGKATAFLGSLLRIKPLLTIREGEAHPLGRARTRAKGIDRLCEIAEGFANLEALSVLHSTTSDEAQSIAHRLKHLLPKGEVIIARFGPVVGTYLGPEALGIALRHK